MKTSSLISAVCCFAMLNMHAAQEPKAEVLAPATEASPRSLGLSTLKRLAIGKRPAPSKPSSAPTTPSDDRVKRVFDFSNIYRDRSPFTSSPNSSSPNSPYLSAPPPTAAGSLTLPAQTSPARDTRSLAAASAISSASVPSSGPMAPAMRETEGSVTINWTEFALSHSGPPSPLVADACAASSSSRSASSASASAPSLVSTAAFVDPASAPRATATTPRIRMGIVYDPDGTPLAAVTI